MRPIVQCSPKSLTLFNCSPSLLLLLLLFRRPTVVIVQALHRCLGGATGPPCRGTCVRGVFTALFTAARRPPGPPTHDLKAGLHHLSHREAYGATWSSLGSSLAKSTFGRPARGALRSGRAPNIGLTLGIWSQVLAYCCSRGLLFTIVVHQAHCCSVVTVHHEAYCSEVNVRQL